MRSRLRYIESMRWVTAKPPKMFTLASATATSPSHLAAGLPAAAAAMRAPKTTTRMTSAAITPPRLFALSTRGTVRHDTPGYAAGDAFLFGSETRGLPDDVLDAVPADRRLRLPMRPGNRSVNLSNAVAVVVFEAWRQQGFPGGG